MSRFYVMTMCGSGGRIVLVFLFAIAVISSGFAGVVVTASSSSSISTETIIGIVGKDFVLLASDSSSAVGGGGVAFTKSTNVDKIFPIVDPLPNLLSLSVPTVSVAAIGDAAHVERIIHLLRTHATIHEYRATGAGYDMQYIDWKELMNRKHTMKPQNQQQGSNHPVDYELDDNKLFSIHSVASLARTTIAEKLRSSSPYNVALLVGGMMSVVQNHEYHVNNDSYTTATPIRKQLISLLGLENRMINSGECGFTNPSNTADMAASRRSFGLTKKETTVPVRQPCLYWLDEYGSIQGGMEYDSNTKSIIPLLPYAVHGLGSYSVWSILDQHYHREISKDDAIQLIHLCFTQLRKRFLVNTNQSPVTIKCIDQYGCTRMLA